MIDTASIDCSNITPEDLRALLSSRIDEATPLLKLTNLSLPTVTKPTPDHWRSDCATELDEAFLSIAAMVGDVFGFANLQDGHLTQEILPIAADAQKQLGSGAVKLELHTEDPALPYRADYLGFICVSNCDRVPTNVSVPNLSALSANSIRVLSSQKFEIMSDRPADGSERPPSLFSELLFLRESDSPRMIYDPIYINYDRMSSEQASAFNELTEMVEGSVCDFLLLPGEIGFIDNYRVAHGRPQYKPRYDGTDRWLKRVQISADLMPHRHLEVRPRVLP